MRRSISNDCSSSDAATSAAVTDPYKVSVSPTRRAMTQTTWLSRAANASALSFSAWSRASAMTRSRSTCRRLASVTGNANRRGRR